MTPSSEELEAFHDRACKLYERLGPSRNFVGATQLPGLADAARDWLKISSALKETVEGMAPALHNFDQAMADVLKATKQRTRTNVYRKYLEPFKKQFMDALVLPLMMYEGSPSQTAARQLEGVFTGLVSSEEEQYISEAARCSSVKCHRAAIVMLWAAAIARLHAEIQKVGFNDYNAAAALSVKKKGAPYNRIQNGINVSSQADLQLGRDFDVIAVGIELWKYDSQSFEELNRCLNIRNTAAHPGSFEPTSLDVRQFAEKIKRFVFDFFAARKKI